MILLSSFVRARAKDFPLPAYSAAVYQPEDGRFEKAQWADIRRSGGGWIRPREFENWKHPLNGYFAELYSLYGKREREILRWVDRHEDCALLCWCPYEKAAQRQLRAYGSYVCHLGVIEAFLRERWVTVKVDDDRKDKMVRFF